MAPVFAHGRLRLYLLKLLDEAPRHGYEVIRLLEERFHGLYAPSAGTVYPRLAKLEKEGLVTHSTEGGRKVYSISDGGRAELAARADEIADLENEIRESVSTLAAEIREDVRGAAGDLRREIRAAAQQARSSAPSGNGSGTDFRAMKQEWKDQARRAKEESRRAKEDARTARLQAKEAQEFARVEVQRIAKQVQEQVQSHVREGDWQGGLKEGLAELNRELGALGRATGHVSASWPGHARKEPGAPTDADAESAEVPADAPDWARENASEDVADPGRELERLLDRFRDDIRDAARDRGVDAGQLRESRRHLSTAAARIAAVLRGRTD
ncbi:PadR family transcriptional regulator [Streptomyces sp. SPB162]|uniref:PadR family transcriptional regulator n=1 Tax=Streptomyces sp. SPB162 TaxID=2940560 RepID=UPI00240642E7|nr:PadR family transcriptional regulator [Streptomyces sp. SPB162]MDF9815579.1 DNA-binding PadR family transcriptional regulator/F0F1-type ATP synthase membrane subunit b/b' [Streptomyces sp. SPB162]